ncbi:MAG TPA: PEP-CTERM sorting domain-containing protein [Phycisphaerae bacterium]|nr:PEP-CTERM sorting domain-containing protein [Phycisphaerae bacterium]
MRGQSQTSRIVLCSVIMALAAVSQGGIIETDFVSASARQSLDGTALGLTTNAPNSTWSVAAGWNWGNPFIPATWDPPGIPTNLANLVEEKTVLGISIASSGGYTKPAQIHMSTDIEFPGSRNHTGGVGFFSVLPARADNQNQFEHFTGLHINETNGTLQVMADGALTGSPVSVGTISEGVFYNVGFDIDTLTGALSNVTFDGSPVGGLSSNAFTDVATAFAAVVVGGASRAYIDNFTVSEIAAPEGDVPEPASLALLGLAATGLGGYVRRRRNR